MTRKPVKRINVKMEIAENASRLLPADTNLTQLVTFLLSDFQKRAQDKIIQDKVDIFKLYYKTILKNDETLII